MSDFIKFEESEKPITTFANLNNASNVMVDHEKKEIIINYIDRRFDCFVYDEVEKEEFKSTLSNLYLACGGYIYED